MPKWRAYKNRHTFYLLFRGKPRKNNDTDPEAALKPPASDLSPEELSQF